MSFGQRPLRRNGRIPQALSFALLVMPLVAIQPRQFWSIVIVASFLGLAIEGLKLFTDRATQMGDIIANWVNAILGAAIGWLFARIHSTS